MLRARRERWVRRIHGKSIRTPSPAGWKLTRKSVSLPFSARYSSNTRPVTRWNAFIPPVSTSPCKSGDWYTIPPRRNATPWASSPIGDRPATCPSARTTGWRWCDSRRWRGCCEGYFDADLSRKSRHNHHFSIILYSLLYNFSISLG